MCVVNEDALYSLQKELPGMFYSGARSNRGNTVYLELNNYKVHRYVENKLMK